MIICKGSLVAPNVVVRVALGPLILVTSVGQVFDYYPISHFALSLGERT